MLRGLEALFQQLHGGAGGIRAVLAQRLDQLQQLLGPDLTVTPCAEAGLRGIELSPNLIGDGACRGLLGGDHVFAGLTTQQAGSTDHTSWAELANRGQASVMTRDQTRLTLQQDQQVGGNGLGSRHLLAQLEPQQTRGMLEFLRPLWTELLESRVP